MNSVWQIRLSFAAAALSSTAATLSSSAAAAASTAGRNQIKLHLVNWSMRSNNRRDRAQAHASRVVRLITAQELVASQNSSAVISTTVAGIAPLEIDVGTGG